MLVFYLRIIILGILDLIDIIDMFHFILNVGNYNNFKFIGQIATYEINNNFTDSIVFFKYIKWINWNEKNVTTKGVQNYYLIYEYDESKSLDSVFNSCALFTFYFYTHNDLSLDCVERVDDTCERYPAPSHKKCL